MLRKMFYKSLWALVNMSMRQRLNLASKLVLCIIYVAWLMWRRVIAYVYKW